MTLQTLAAKIYAGLQVTIVVVGNSVGVGARATDFDTYVEYLPNDQITEAFRYDTRVQSWVIQLRAYLQTKNAGSDLINLSGSGWDTLNHMGIDHGASSVVGSVDTVTQVAAMNPLPDLVLLPLQINDANHSLGVPAFSANTATLLQGFIAAGVTPVLVKESPADVTNYAAYLAEVDVIAAAEGVELIDTFTPFPVPATAYKADYAHPNQLGHDLITATYTALFDSLAYAGTYPISDGTTEYTGTLYPYTLGDPGPVMALKDEPGVYYKVGTVESGGVGALSDGVTALQLEIL